MTEQFVDFTGFPELPTYEADWVAVYMEPIVQSGERITIGVVATDGAAIDGQLAISEKMLQCLYGDSAAGMRTMMELALQRALKFARSGFKGQFSPGMHGVSISKKRHGLGDDLDDIILQGISLTSSLCDLHANDGTQDEHERTAYWCRFKTAMEKINAGLVPYFGKPVEVTIRGSTIPLPCDYFSSRLAVNICGLQPGYRLTQLFDAASSRLARLEQLKNHDALIAHGQKASLLLVAPPAEQQDRLKPSVRRKFEERILLLQDMADNKSFNLLTVPSPIEGARIIDKLERAA